MEVLSTIPKEVLVVAFLCLVLVTAIISVNYIRYKGLDGIREDVYQLILLAEKNFKGNKEGQEKFEFVIRQTIKLMPAWLQLFVTEKALRAIVQTWFNGVKDLLDDGKINESQK